MKVITEVIKTMYPNLTDKSVSVLENEVNLVLVQELADIQRKINFANQTSSVEELIRTSDVSKIQDRVKEVLDNLWTCIELQRRESLIKSFFNELFTENFKEMENNVRPADKVQTEQPKA
jgi:hypothetical protein